jgi:hypothetical protein
MPVLNYRDPGTGNWVPLNTIATPSSASNLAPVAPQTANFTAAANTVYPVDCTAGNVTATLPTSPANGATIVFILTAAVSPSVLTVNCGGTSHFNTVSGPTAKTLVNPGDNLYVIYSTANATWLVITDVLRSLFDGPQITWDSSQAGRIVPQLTANLSANSVRLAGVLLTSVRCCTVVPLATTYANGSVGLGATLTATANGAIPAIDNVTPAVNDRILVNNQANPPENGVYLVTAAGDASNPFVLTRATDADVNTDLQLGVEVRVQDGTIWGGVYLRSYPVTNITVGTTPLKWFGTQRPQVSPADVHFGSQRDRKQLAHEFGDMSTTAITVNATKIPGGCGSAIIYLSGTAAQAAQNETADTMDGVCELNTGTDTTGRCAVALTWKGEQFAPGGAYGNRARFFARVKIPTLTVNTTNMFTVRLGWMNAGASSMTYGIWFELPADGSTVKCVAGHASTFTTVDSTFTQNTAFRTYSIDYDENTATLYYYLSTPNPTLVGTITTNLPTGAGDAIVPAVWILKSSGATAGVARVDYLASMIPHMNSGMLASL